MANAGFWQGMSQATQAAGKMGMDVFALKGQQEDRDISLGIARDRNLIAAQDRQDRNAIAQQQMAIHAQEVAAKTPQHLKPMNPSSIVQAKIATKQAYGDAGLKAFEPVFTAVDQVAKSSEGSTFGDAYQAALSSYPKIREEMMSTLEKELTSGKLTPTQQQSVQQVYDAVSYDKTGERILGEGIFKNTASSIKATEENSKSALEAARGENRLDVVDARNAQRQAEMEARLMARQGGGDGVDEKKLKRMDDVATRIEKNAADEAKRKTAMKYSIQPTFTTDAEGKVQVVWPANRPEVFQYYETERKNIVNGKTSAAVKRGLLDKSYMPEAEAPAPSGTPIANPTAASAKKKIGSTSAPAVGEVREVDGKRYKYMGNNKWEDA